jgi:adenosylcobinamide-GDP ribazoletransferase
MRAPERTGSIRAAIAAVSFLTRLPIGGAAAAVTEADLRAGAAWFPAVGALVGLLGATGGWLVAMRAPAALAAVLVVVIETLATGAFHLDGLADTADGLGAASTGRDPLPVMRESTVGAFGVVAVVLDLALRIAATTAVLGRGFPWAIVAAAGAARFAPLVLARTVRYLRPNGGSGSWVGGGVPAGTMVFAAATSIAVCAAAGAARAAAILVTVLLVSAAIGAIARQRFSGVTGDVFGAAAELAQTLALAAVAVVG